MSEFARGFRLHLAHGQVLDGAEFPNGRAFVMDDQDWGLCSTARTIELLQAGYGGGRIEWADQAPAEAAQPCNQHPHAPVIGGLCGGCTQYGETLPGTPTIAGWTGERQGPTVSGGDVARPAGLDALPDEPCTDPRHTGPIREQLGCSGPDPATT